MVETQIRHKCEETFSCFYRKDGLCTFWEQAEAIPAAWEKVFDEDPDDDAALRDIDTFREPCLIEMEKRDFACAGFHIPFEKGWQDCENCNNSLCPYEGQRFYIGDELAWMRDLPVSAHHNVRLFTLLKVLKPLSAMILVFKRRLTDKLSWWRHGVWCWWRNWRHTPGKTIDMDF
ncbi:hypothetical protein ES703_95648 [subsurface metagenome]